MIRRLFLVVAVLAPGVRGQDFIAADVTTSEGDFTLVLDYLRSPLAVSNFIHLAGKGDDIFETPNNVPLLTTVGHYRQSFYKTTAESDTQRLPLRVDFIPATLTHPAFYAVYQSETYLGGVQETLVEKPYYEDITGEDRIRLELVGSNPIRYRITLRYPRPWLDVRNLNVRDAPMYRGMRIHRVETGKRFFAGSMTADPLENPGYEFQDEVLRSPGANNNPFGTPFNSAWVLGMDSVGPNRNGSRFFITTAADPMLNGRYTAFGFVAQNIGRNVVTNIANSVTDANQNPTTNMYIHDIKIRRGGLTAIGFFESVHQAFMPGPIEVLPMRIERNGSQFSLIQPSRPGSQTALYTSTDLVNYSGGFFVAQSPLELEESIIDLTQTVVFSPRLFVKAFAAPIPYWPSAELDLDSSRFGMEVTSNDDEGSLSFVLGTEQKDAEGKGTGVFGGTYSIDMTIERNEFGKDPVLESVDGEGSFLAKYDSSQGPYKGVFKFQDVMGPLNIDELTLHLDSNRFSTNPGIQEFQIIRRFEARRNLDPADSESTFLSYGGLYQKFE